VRVGRIQLVLYAAGFVCALVASGVLVASVVGRSLGASYSVVSMIFSVLAVVLGLAAVQRK
jgi:hypothetical protein